LQIQQSFAIRAGAAITPAADPAENRPELTGEPLLRVRLFGQVHAEDATGRSVLPRSRKTRAVLAVLAMAGSKPVLRSRLTGLLWSRRGPEQARASLRQAVHELQSAFGPLATALLRADRHHLHLVLLNSRVWVDVAALLGASVGQPDGLELFQPSLLDDLNGLDPAFDTWLSEERRRVTLRARSLAEGLLAVAHGFDERIAAAERLLSIDRLHEGAWQTLIRGRLDKCDRAAARLAYERCAAALSDVGLAPSAETETLVSDMLPRRPGAGFRPQSVPSSQGIRLIVLPPRALDGRGSDGLLPGLAEEITAALSRFRWMSCVAAGFPGMPLPAEWRSGHAWRQLDADLLLDSTTQCSGNRIRIIVRLLDVRAAGTVVWARRFDRDMHDILTLQGEIAAEAAAQIDPELLIREGDRLGSANRSEPTPHELVLRAIPAIYRLEPSGFRAAGKLLAAASAMAPDHAAAHAWWAYWHLFLVGQGWTNDPIGATMRAGELAERAVTLDPADARALALVGHVRGFLHKRAEEARALHERALSLNPNLPLAWCFSGFANSYLGRHDDAIEQIMQAQRLSPHDPHGFFFDMALMMPHFLRGDFEQAAALARRAVELNPGCSSTYKGYLATLGHLGNEEEAARIRGRLLVLEPGFSIRNAVERSPMIRQDDRSLYAEGLRRGGLREG
jgi:DNA-binding SARP family transcriptional activator/TolB-like protein/Flp pilus assembly protein TadD